MGKTGNGEMGQMVKVSRKGDGIVQPNSTSIKTGKKIAKECKVGEYIFNRTKNHLIISQFHMTLNLHQISLI